MSKQTPLRSLGIAGVAAVLLGSCATASAPEGNFSPPRTGSTWTVAQHNTGSFGKDTQFEVKRGDTVWKGQPAITYTNLTTGIVLAARPTSGQWLALVGRARSMRSGSAAKAPGTRIFLGPARNTACS